MTKTNLNFFFQNSNFSCVFHAMEMLFFIYENNMSGQKYLLTCIYYYVTFILCIVQQALCHSPAWSALYT